MELATQRIRSKEEDTADDEADEEEEQETEPSQARTNNLSVIERTILTLIDNLDIDLAFLHELKARRVINDHILTDIISRPNRPKKVSGVASRGKTEEGKRREGDNCSSPLNFWLSENRLNTFMLQNVRPKMLNSGPKNPILETTISMSENDNCLSEFCRKQISSFFYAQKQLLF